MDTRRIVRQGPAWNIGALGSSDRQIILDEFHRLARLYGSQAEWLPETGEVVTSNPVEMARAFPYEAWALAAYRHINTVWEHETIWEDAGEEAPPYGQLH